MSIDIYYPRGKKHPPFPAGVGLNRFADALEGEHVFADRVFDAFFHDAHEVNVVGVGALYELGFDGFRRCQGHVGGDVDFGDAG
jgi:hypothetical protein